MTSVARKCAYFRRTTSTILPFSLTTKHHEQLETSLQDILETVITCYVNSWYPSISPRDKTFLPHLYRLLVDLLRSISTEIIARTNEGAFDELILIKLPEILSSHLFNWRRAQEDADQWTLDCRQSPEALAARFCVLHGHDAVRQRAFSTTEAPQSAVDPLPREGTNLLPNDVDRSLDEAMSSSLHGDVFSRHSQPPPGPMVSPNPLARTVSAHAHVGSLSASAQYEVSLNYLSTLSDRLLRYHLSPTDYASPTERAIATEILASAVLSNAIEKLSQGWMICKIALAVLGESNPQDLASKTTTKETQRRATPKGLSDLLFDAYHTIVLLMYQVTSVLLTISRWYTTTSAQWKSISEFSPGEHVHEASTERWTQGVSGAMEPSLQLLSTMLDVNSTLKDRRQSVREIMSWFEMAAGSLVLGKYADKLLPLYLHEHVFTPAALIRVSSLLQDMLFPNGEIAPPTPDPSEEEVLEMEARLVSRLTEAIPGHVRLLMFGANSDMHAIAVERMISPFRNSRTNLHLMVRMVEAVILTIDPRLAKGE